MREIKIIAPLGKGANVAQVALRAGIKEVGVHRAFFYGANAEKDVITINASTPIARQFISALERVPGFNRFDYSIASDSQESIISAQGRQELTLPMTEPTAEVLSSLWQRSHVTSGFIARSFASSITLAYGMLANHYVLIVAALLFKPFLSLMQAFAAAVFNRDRNLFRHAGFAFFCSITLTLSGSFLVGIVAGGPIGFSQFSPVWADILISLAVGGAAGLSVADDTGVETLIGMAAAAQYGILLAWIGLSLAVGFPEMAVVMSRMLNLFVNLAGLFAGSYIAFNYLKIKERLPAEKIAENQEAQKKAG